MSKTLFVVIKITIFKLKYVSEYYNVLDLPSREIDQVYQFCRELQSQQFYLLHFRLSVPCAFPCHTCPKI